MKKYMTINDIKKDAANEHITANELDLLVAKTRELSHIRERELRELQTLLAKLEEQLEGTSSTST